MIIVFFDIKKKKLHICSENEKTRVIGIDEPDIIDYIPNDDILYVENAHFLTRQQFAQWINKGVSSSPKKQKPTKQRYFIHPRHNGAIRLQDIHTEKYPEGVQMIGKWDFIPVDEIGEDVLDDSANFRWALAKGKIEIVDSNYVKENIHKKYKQVSPAEAALDSILVPADIKADAAATAGEFFVE